MNKTLKKIRKENEKTEEKKEKIYENETETKK